MVDPGGGSDEGAVGGGDQSGGASSGTDVGEGSSDLPRCVVGDFRGYYAGLADPQPELDNPVWDGHDPDDGAIYVCADGRLIRPGFGTGAPDSRLY
ncbi:hypothetical protein ACQEVI_17835 [Promicromonospora sp. CA-289599]|uniref:hypothetical protein n=1 Tax=Promicromonospora sp. CA-289599 TaxID=3240014 RepID=UPI003D8B7717